MPRSVSYEDAEMMTDDELIALAIESNPGLNFGRVENGLTMFLQITRCINLWRNEECYLASDPPRGTLEGYPPRKAGGCPTPQASKESESGTGYPIRDTDW